ncbi:MAG TPA: RNA polymerase sigma factor [Candidatus Sulfotelmatobacter sp.]|jgi:RNA polymerase sigma-70 factor (ECF subfamily)|nr:RNA polymerase sigma factor [Candidatus Sulfotelmatobacter sp.]
MPVLELSSLGQPLPEKSAPGQSELLRQFARGDLDAFETLFRRHQAEVYRSIVVIVRDPFLAEDLTVEAFWRIHRAHARFDPERSFEAWARRIATNVAIDYFKSASHSFARHTQGGDDPDPLENLPQPPSPDPAITMEVRTKTAQAFRQLPPSLQVAATLALIEEQPYGEIAATLGISIGAVKLRVFRAVRLLRKQLIQQGIKP